MPRRLQSLALGVAAFSALAAASAVPRTSPNANALAARRLQKRYNEHSLTSISCGLYSSADTVDTSHNIDNLNNGNEKPIAAGTCNRIGCFNTSGVYVCNDNAEDITVTNADGSAFAGLIAGVCYNGGEGHHPLSGQAFTSDQGGYNVVVAFCDSHDPVDTPPSAYTPPGPDGPGNVYCGGNDADACDIGTCNPDTLIVATQDNVVCDVYLGPNTIPAGDTYTSRSIGTTWTVGGALGIDSSDLAAVAVQATFFATFAKTTTTGDISGTSAMCGGEDAEGDFTCDLQVAPGCYRMTGTCLTSLSQLYNIRTAFDTTQPQAKADDGQGVWSSQICTCHNCCDWANPTAPEFACFEDCATCVQLDHECGA
ncbi:hypothetical protein LTR37_010162 [Vermiconidia calcicola]|uniref:Uncharacterized protein n=1 Tax=Vermiconidia calcicola TaxID=1690605 RepID=A0ACC3N628_9PEZI|nr:hypothetical protein LTR37_010162 [Vermiconidia calcicola]